MTRWLLFFVIIIAAIMLASFDPASAESGPDTVIFCYNNIGCRIIYSSEPISSTELFFRYQNYYYPQYLKHHGTYHIPNLPPDPIPVPVKPRFIFFSNEKSR